MIELLPTDLTSMLMLGNIEKQTEVMMINIGVSIVKIVIALVVVLTMVAYLSLAERKFSAAIQDRIGPNRTGIPFTNIGLFGLIQPLADGLKFVLKEQFVPANVYKFFYVIAPALTLMPALITMGLVPYGSIETLQIGDFYIEDPGVIANASVGILLIFAISSLGVYGIVIGGWASNSKYPFLGGVRSSAQMISYEVSLGLSVIPVFMLVGHLNLSELIVYQANWGWLAAPWFWAPAYFDADGNWMAGRWIAHAILTVPLFFCFIVFLISAFAETNRLPFDLAESETELVGGFHTEYSGMRFAQFFMGEYAAMVVISGLMVTLFLGGWSLPVPYLNEVGDGWFQIGTWTGLLLQIVTFLVKVVLFLFLFIWVRWTLPRFRYDQLMAIGWKFFLPLTLVNVILFAALLAIFQDTLRLAP